MTLKRVLIANRGEISVRIARAAAERGIEAVAVAAVDDTASAHATTAPQFVTLPGSGPRAYLDIDAIIYAATTVGADAIHPGYGFLSESAAFANAVKSAGLTFVGPDVQTLEILGHKAAARALATKLRIPTLAGTDEATSLTEAHAFFASLPPGGAMMIKAIAGGGGRGIRLVSSANDIDDAFARCQSEARHAFGVDALYVEQAMPRARHIEVQIVGDGSGAVAVLGERECSLQRRNQKIVEYAPSPTLTSAVRDKLFRASAALAEALRYKGLGTFEFLVDASGAKSATPFAFIEANARLQVEHTVTEYVFDVDLVGLQLAIAGGASLKRLGMLDHRGAIEGRRAIQLRVNAETMQPDGAARPATGEIASVRFPGGRGVRVDTHVYPGFSISPSYDSLVAKIIVETQGVDHAGLIAKARRAIGEFEMDGVTTNAGFLAALLEQPAVVQNAVTTRYIDEHAGELLPRANTIAASLNRPTRAVPASQTQWSVTPATLVSPLPGSLVSVAVAAGQTVRRGETLAVIESMKMEHLINAPRAGRITSVHVAARDVVREGQPLLEIEADDTADDAVEQAAAVDLDHIRADLKTVVDRHAFTLDANRADAVKKRAQLGMRTARTNVEDLLDPGSFIEYGALMIAAQRSRRSLDDLVRNTPADGLIVGLGTVNAEHTSPDAARVAVMAYDYTVLAGTQGKLNHKKSDRLLDVAQQWNLPIVLFAEGGGGRPGDVDWTVGVAGLDCTTFHHFARLSGVMPRVGIVAGRCFAGNAALLGSADVVIATENSSIGMGGPAMIEGGGLGVVAPDDVGPISVQAPNGCIDILVKDEGEAVAAARQYLGYFQGPRKTWTAGDQRLLRHAIPENRLRVYDIRTVIDGLFDVGSVLELRREFGIGVVTALARIEGRPVGVIANNPKHLGGAIDAPACDKLARFLQLCDAFALPVVSLCDTPGFMVGTESEKTAMVRKTSRLFVIGSSMRVPMLTIVLRKGYGLGAQAMAAGMFHAPLFNVSWPTGEFGGMGLEGAVRLGFRKELEAAGPDKSDALFKELVDKSYEKGKAINMAAFHEIDAVIDPADTRRWIVRGLASAPAQLPPRRAVLDTW